MSAWQELVYGTAAFSLSFVLGVLTGNHLLTRQQKHRARKIARAQRRLTEQHRSSLGGFREAYAEAED
jgi:hypothetical protein